MFKLFDLHKKKRNIKKELQLLLEEEKARMIIKTIPNIGYVSISDNKKKRVIRKVKNEI